MAKKKKKKKRKVRVEFRKNRESRVRQQNLTREVLNNEDALDHETGERLSGKGSISRHRTIVTDDEDELLRKVDLDKCLAGRVVSFIGQNCRVQSADGRQFTCSIRRVVRTMSRDSRNAVVTGDHVMFLPLDNDEGVIERVEPRRGILSRQSKRHEHIIVANIDQTLIVVSASDPPLKPGLIDRYLISSEKGGVDSVICINKVDLVDPTDLQPVVGVYAGLGYSVVLTSTLNGTGIQELRRLLKDRETVLSGQSGVGKSTLLNAIDDNLELKTGTVSDWSGKGRHTTRRAELIPMKFGGWVADTPGVRSFGLWDVIPEEVEGYFIEFRPFVTQCRFPDCSHTHEKDCGVKTAVGRRMISSMRYESYLRIISEDTRGLLKELR